MAEQILPLLLEPELLLTNLQQAREPLLLVDVCSKEDYTGGHVPGAMHLNPALLQSGVKPAVGKLPDITRLRAIFSALGLRPEHHVVAMDHEGGGWAARLLWTLDCIGHTNYSYLNGGTRAWQAAGLLTSTKEATTEPTRNRCEVDSGPIAYIRDIKKRLDDPGFAIWDARSAEEFSGEKVVSERGGHIPGAINIDWLELIDEERDLRLTDLEQLRSRLAEAGLTPDKDIVTHCQSHHRSALAYLVMKILGYPSIKGYDGSWSEWGNLEDTPIEPDDTPVETAEE